MLRDFWILASGWPFLNILLSIIPFFANCWQSIANNIQIGDPNFVLNYFGLYFENETAYKLKLTRENAISRIFMKQNSFLIFNRDPVMTPFISFGIFKYYHMFTWSGYEDYLLEFIYVYASYFFFIPWLPALLYII